MTECTFCGRTAVYHDKTAGVYRCDRCFIEYIDKNFRRNVTKHELVEPGDRIIAAVSGGTDSVTNLHLLAEYTEHRRNELISLTIDEGIQGYRDESLPVARKNSEKLDVEHVVVSVEEMFGKPLDEIAEISQEKNGPDPCTICGILRRSLLNQASRELDADKLAIAHNLDDEVQTIMLNYLRGDISRLYRLRPKTSGKEGFVPRIKPIREITEKEAAIYSMVQDFEVHSENCPYVGGMRSEVRDFMNEMENNHPTTKFKVLRMFDKIRPNLPADLGDVDLGTCEVCGEPCTGSLCRTCELLKKIGLKREKSLIFE